MHQVQVGAVGPGEFVGLESLLNKEGRCLFTATITSENFSYFIVPKEAIPVMFETSSLLRSMNYFYCITSNRIDYYLTKTSILSMKNEQIGVKAKKKSQAATHTRINSSPSRINFGISESIMKTIPSQRQRTLPTERSNTHSRTYTMNSIVRIASPAKEHKIQQGVVKKTRSFGSIRTIQSARKEKKPEVKFTPYKIKFTEGTLQLIKNHHINERYVYPKKQTALRLDDRWHNMETF